MIIKQIINQSFNIKQINFITTYLLQKHKISRIMLSCYKASSKARF